jgi:hypothetical protein
MRFVGTDAVPVCPKRETAGEEKEKEISLFSFPNQTARICVKNLEVEERELTQS